MFLTTVGLGVEEVDLVRGHIERLVSITDATFIGSLPVRIPESTSTGIVEITHAVVVIPIEMLLTALLERGVEPGGGVGVHPGGLLSVVEASRLESVLGLIRVEQIDAWRGRRCL